MERTYALLDEMPAGVLVVAESGFRSAISSNAWRRPGLTRC